MPVLWALIVDPLLCRGSIKIEYTLARHGAERLWKLLKTEPFVNSLGALTGKPCSCCCLAAVSTTPAAQPEHQWLGLPCPGVTQARPHSELQHLGWCRWAGGADGQGRVEGHLLLRLAGGS